MKHYILKSHSQNVDYMTIESESEEGYIIKIVRDKDGYNEITTDFITKELFEACLRTGYITLVENVSENIATA
ncbi:MAG: hypothetical protein SPI86_08320 [Treponemataceae bacterium]|nr:hypothetical protein [Spirochaetales bacterium]MDY6031747.1 hypothetical protein [Treponemataceae bacterium]